MKIIIDLSKEEVETLDFINDYIWNASVRAFVKSDPDRTMLSKSAYLTDKILSSIGE